MRVEYKERILSGRKPAETMEGKEEERKGRARENEKTMRSKTVQSIT